MEKLLTIKTRLLLKQFKLILPPSNFQILVDDFTSLIEHFCNFFRKYRTTDVYMALIYVINDGHLQYDMVKRYIDHKKSYNELLKNKNSKNKLLKLNSLLFNFYEIMDIFAYQKIEYIEEDVDCLCFSEVLDYLMKFYIFCTCVCGIQNTHKSFNIDVYNLTGIVN